MPNYQFECRNCGEVWDKILRMNEPKEDLCPKCKQPGSRVFTVPNMGIDTTINSFDLDRLAKKTGTMKGTVGDLFDMAQEHSEKRGGEKDPIRKKALADYAKLRKGKKYRNPKESVSIEFRLKRDAVKVQGSKKGKK